MTLDYYIGVTSLNHRRSVHFRGMTWLSHRHGMGVEWAWKPIPRPWTPWMGRRFIDGRLWFLSKKKRCTVLMTSHITWRLQYSATVNLKIKVCMEWVSECDALHFNTLHDHYSTTLHNHYSIARTTLHCTHYTALYSLHHSTLYTALYSIHCTVLTPLHHHYSTSLHCTHFTVCSDLHLIKEPKI